MPRETKFKERPDTGGKHTQSAKQKEVQERESERPLDLLGLPPLSECKGEGEEVDSDDSTGTVSAAVLLSTMACAASPPAPVRRFLQ